MADNPTPDPMAFFRNMVTQWETMANDIGSKVMGSSEAAQAIHAGTSISLKAQQLTNEAMAKGLASANMPSKADVDALGARLSVIENQLARIENVLGVNAASAVSALTKPKRTKTPPKAAA